MPALKIILMDAGQGDAILVVFPDESLMLVDCGCKKNEYVIYGQIESILDFYLKATGNHLNALVLTHPDGDHCNLIQKLIINKKVTIGSLVYGGDKKSYNTKINNVALNKLVTKSYVLSPKYFKSAIDKELSFDGKTKFPDVDVRILAANVGDDANDKSVVLMLTCGKINVLLMGDAEKKTEAFLIAKIDKTPALKAIITKGISTLKVGHHGSNTSSTQDWIDYLKPETALISSDTKSFGSTGVSLPRSEIISRFTTLYDGKKAAQLHNYVQYNGTSQEHEMQPTTAWLFTNLHILVFKKKRDAQGKKLFTSYGTSWYYQTDGAKEDAWPACGWENVNKTY